MAINMPLDQTKLEAFSNRVFENLGATYATAMCILGDRLGLFKALAAHGPATSAELAKHAGINERYAREWLSALACADYMQYDPATRRFSLSPEQAAVLADEDSPCFIGGEFEELPALLGVLDPLTTAFRDGGG